MPVSCRKSRHSVHRCQQAHLWDSAQTLFPTVLPYFLPPSISSLTSPLSPIILMVIRIVPPALEGSIPLDAPRNASTKGTSSGVHRTSRMAT